MKQILTRIYKILVIFGFDPIKTIRSIRGLPAYIRDLKTLKSQRSSATRAFPLGMFFPYLGDRFTESGSAKGQYFHQDLLVARRIHFNRPQRHIDVGSRIDGFVAHVATFREIEVLDLRPLSSRISNVTFRQADLMASVPDDLMECCDSLSCLHAIEHFGLGRYGDSVNYDGYILGLNNLHRMLKKGGKLYISVPIGPQRIEFNAHRVFSVSYLCECFETEYAIDQFSFVDDYGEIHENCPVTDDAVQANFGCMCGCGIFELTKL